MSSGSHDPAPARSSPAPFVRPPELARRGALDVFRGFAIALRGLRLVFATPRLTALTAAVALVTLVTLVVLGAVLWHMAPEWVGLVWAPPTSTWARALYRLVIAATFAGLFIAGANTLPMMLAAPLMDPLSVQTERLLGFESGDGGLGRAAREILRAWANALVRLVVLGAGQLLFLLLLSVPAAEPLVTALGFAWTSLWVAAAYLDVPMARHLYSIRDELRVLRQRPALFLGFGAAISLLLWVPLLNAVFVPVAVVSATLLFRGLVASGQIAPPGEKP